MTFMRPFELPEKDSTPLHKTHYDLGKIVLRSEIMRYKKKETNTLKILKYT